MLRLTLLCLLASYLLVAPPARSAANEPDYLAELIHQATAAQLAAQRHWQLLLHYRPNRAGGYTSEMDDPQFFLAPNGKTDPQAELAATLRYFFSTALVGSSGQTAQCAFIARYHWLKATLSIDDLRLPPQRCARFQRWVAELNPASITLIFTSAYMNNPASLFGHTLLRIDRQGQTEQTRLLAYTIGYAARVTSSNGLDYVVSGISGGFRGYFSIEPYYSLVKEYGDFENRDIWEYRLNLTKSQIGRMLMHLWELRNSYFDYYFFKENCAYQLLSLLEAANPELHLTDQFTGWTVPADTVRLLTSQPGLIAEITPRPAPSTQLRRQLTALSGQEQRAMNRLIHTPEWAQSAAFANLAAERQALILELASDYLRYRGIRETRDSNPHRDQIHGLLVARSHLNAASPPIPTPPYATQPELGHESSRAGVGIGRHQGEWFTELSVRAGYHDLLDPDAGYTPAAQIEVVGVSVRYYPERQRLSLDRLTVLDIVSLSPVDSLFFVPSWKVRAGLETVNLEECRYCLAFNLNGGIGLAAQTHWLDGELYFIFPELDITVSHAFEEQQRSGAGVTAGALVTLNDRWKILVSSTYLHYPWGDTSQELRAFFGLSHALAQNLVLRFELYHRDQNTQAALTLHAFF